MKMIELKKGLYVVSGEIYMIYPRDCQKVEEGRTLVTREIRGDFRHAEYYFVGVVKNVERERLVLNPATRYSTYAVDFGHVYEKTTVLEKAEIPIENIEDIIGMEETNGKN